MVKSNDLERLFSIQREAVDAAIRFANDSGKEGKPGVVLFQKAKTAFEKIWTYGEWSGTYSSAQMQLLSPAGDIVIFAGLDFAIRS